MKQSVNSVIRVLTGGALNSAIRVLTGEAECQQCDQSADWWSRVSTV